MENCATSFTPASHTEPTPVEETVVRLRQDGLSIAKIMQATGLPERQVKRLIKDVTVEIQTPFSKSVARIFDLAVRPQGVKDYELRSILHEEYGSEWNLLEGQYRSSFDSNTIKRVREKVREQAEKAGCKAVFVMDWVNAQAPTASRLALEQAAVVLVDRINDLVNEFMGQHATRASEDSEEVDLAQRKQSYAARRHLLKLAITDYHSEPTAALLERTTSVTNSLDGVSDLKAPVIDRQKSVELIPEPSKQDAFLDYVETQGWC